MRGRGEKKEIEREKGEKCKKKIKCGRKERKHRMGKERREGRKGIEWDVK